MIDSRSVADLHPHVMPHAQAFLNECAVNGWLKQNGITVISIATLRDFAAQDALYAIGRTKPGRKVTNAKGGQSWHNFACAMDVLPLRHGKPIWGTSGNGIDDDSSDDNTDELEVWQHVGVLGESKGFEWAGRWTRFREFPHFQITGGLTLAQAMEGARP